MKAEIGTGSCKSILSVTGDVRMGISSRAAIQCIELLECAARWVIGSAHLLGFYLQLQQLPAH